MIVTLLACAALSLVAPRVRIAELKARATRFGIDTSSVFEKQDLVTALDLRAPGVASIVAGHVVPLIAVGAEGGAMGAGVTVDSGKTFWGLKLELPDIASPASATDVLFVLDSAATHSLLSKEASSILAARPTGASATATTASAEGVQGGFVQVDLGTPSLAGGYAVGRRPLQPVVMELPVSAGRHARACGLLGLDFLNRADVELRLRPVAPLAVFHAPRTADAADAVVVGGGDIDPAEIDLSGLVRLQGRRLPPVGLLAVTVDLASSSADGGKSDGKIGSVDAVVDLGSCVTVCNWAAAARIGLMPGDSRLKMGDQVRTCSAVHI